MISRIARKPRIARTPRTRASSIQKHRRPRAWRLSISALVTSIMAVTGMGLLAYPTAASWVSQYNQSKVTADYSAQVDEARPDAKTQIAQAHAYNDALSAGAVLEANNHVPTGAGSSSDDSLSYASILKANDEGLMARLKIPSISLDLPVYHGTADDTLLKGLGHLEGTSLPVGGEGTRSVITGHRGLAEATMFTHLDKVKDGDSLIIEVFGEVLTYRVTSTKVVEPEETEALRTEAGKDLLTLVTCTPLGINTHRILLTGERIYPTPAKDVAAAGKRPEVPAFPWWAVALVAGLVVVGLYLWRSGYAAARAKERALARTRDKEREPRPQTWAEQMQIWMDDDAGVEPRRWFTDLPVPPQISEAENRELLEEIASLSEPSGPSDVQELIDTAEIPAVSATRPSAGASGRTHSI
ncbi:class C sortase [Actinomyces sp. oral taxon 170]|uniref:class C sortase n=3 Tax=Actinomyces TaxID=1654 RepID=UPI000205AE29|nr:class C sortase [Actinomyces sp. oral taxon 170]EGF55464.1 sortase family protein [Actinomyces sp. oral taxon 170 str. F0386]